MRSAGAQGGVYVISAKVAALTEGVLKTMLMTKLKAVLAVVLVFGFVTIGATGLTCRTAAGQDDKKLPPALSEALADYAELNTLSVKWKERSGLGKGAADRFGWKDGGISGPPQAHDLVWQRGKIYSLSTNQQRRGEFAFDGRILAGGAPDRSPDSMPGLLIDLAAEKDPEAEYFGVGSLQPLGIHFPYGTGELLQAKQLASHFLFLLQHGGQLKAVGPAAIDGSPMLQATIVADNRKWRPAQKPNVGQLEMLLRSGPKKRTEAEIQEQLAKAKSVKEVEPRRLQHVVYFDPS